MSHGTEGNTLVEKVSAWVARHGIPFELRVGKQIAQAGWTVSHATYYRDKAGRLREVDIRADIRLPKDELPAVWLTLAIQCKHGNNKPWALFSSPPDGYEKQYPSGFIVGGSGSALMMRYELNQQRKRFRPLDVREKRSIGIARVNLGKAKPDRVDPAYSALRQAVSAAVGISLEWESFLRLDSEVAVVLPVVVFEGKLFDVSIGEDDAHRVVEVNHARVMAPCDTSESKRAIVNVVTPAALMQFLADAQRDVTHVRNTLASDWDKTVEWVRSFQSAKST